MLSAKALLSSFLAIVSYALQGRCRSQCTTVLLQRATRSSWTPSRRPQWPAWCVANARVGLNQCQYYWLVVSLCLCTSTGQVLYRCSHRDSSSSSSYSRESRGSVACLVRGWFYSKQHHRDSRHCSTDAATGTAATAEVKRPRWLAWCVAGLMSVLQTGLQHHWATAEVNNFSAVGHMQQHLQCNWATAAHMQCW
jgi:hypothetical protein